MEDSEPLFQSQRNIHTHSLEDFFKAENYRRIVRQSVLKTQSSLVSLVEHFTANKVANSVDCLRLWWEVLNKRQA